LKKIGTHVRGHFVAYLALFFGLGGTSFAAVNALPKNSVTTTQIKNGTIQKIDINKRTVSALRGLRGPRGLQGIQGIQGIQGAQGAQGTQGAQGDPGPFPGTLPTGKTLRGAWSLGNDQGSGAGSYDNSTISFVFKLASAPTVVKVPLGGPNPDATHCAGTVTAPEAAAGFLCIYVGLSTNTSSSVPTTFGSPFLGPTSGLELENFAAADGNWVQIGSWAVTSP
jgi:hypothetical protein